MRLPKPTPRSSIKMDYCLISSHHLFCFYRQNLEKQFHAQGHGEYREIVEEEFLKEVCGSVYVVVHFYHQEFFNCKIVDKHLRVSSALALVKACQKPSACRMRDQRGKNEVRSYPRELSQRCPRT